MIFLAILNTVFGVSITQRSQSSLQEDYFNVPISVQLDSDQALVSQFLIDESNVLHGILQGNPSYNPEKYFMPPSFQLAGLDYQESASFPISAMKYVGPWIYQSFYQSAPDFDPNKYFNALVEGAYNMREQLRFLQDNQLPELTPDNTIQLIDYKNYINLIVQLDKDATIPHMRQTVYFAGYLAFLNDRVRGKTYAENVDMDSLDQDAVTDLIEIQFQFFDWGFFISSIKSEAYVRDLVEIVKENTFERIRTNAPPIEIL